MTYAPAKFKVATANSLGGDTISKNVTDGLMDRPIKIHTDGLLLGTSVLKIGQYLPNNQLNYPTRDTDYWVFTE